MIRKNHFKIELRVGKNPMIGEWNYYLHPSSRAIVSFQNPLQILVHQLETKDGPLPDTTETHAKVFVGEQCKWQDSDVTINIFRSIWPKVLEFLASFSELSVLLVYFAGLATHSDLISVIPYLPLSNEDNRRFFISEVWKTCRTKNPAFMWIGMEYSSDEFKRLAGTDGFEYNYGTTVMGVIVTEEKVESLLRKYVLDKDTLEQMLTDVGVQCWWVCDSDFEGMTIWHKHFPGEELGKQIREQIIQGLGYPIELSTD